VDGCGRPGEGLHEEADSGPLWPGADSPGSGDIQIDGEEKGVPYADRYKMMDAKAYPASCVEEEAEQRGQTSAIRDPRPEGSAAAGRISWPGRAARDVLGRLARRHR
jgi:hypothetical protein